MLSLGLFLLGIGATAAEIVVIGLIAIFALVVPFLIATTVARYDS